MKISYNWLQTYFKEKLPSPEKVAESFTFHAFEVEGIEKLENDSVFDIKVLPDRAHYALCHKGIALELSAILKLELNKVENKIIPVTSDREVKMDVKDTKAVPRYAARYIEGIKITESPQWLKDRLESVGQRSINNIVDITNYILLDTGQPLHAFDADKIEGVLAFRYAKKGERLVILDDREINLDETVFVEVDDKKILTLAGIKGGKDGGISNSTKNIILDAGNFEATMVRRTATKFDVRSDASKRYENNLLPYFTVDALEQASSIIAELFPVAKIGKINDVYPSPIKQIKLDVSMKAINSLLGINIPEKDMLDILEKIEVKVIKKADELELTIPGYRNDIRDLNDVAEEIGRLYGYDKIKPTLPENTGFKPQIEKTFYYTEKIKNILSDFGFSEVYTYSLVSKGNYEIEKSLASDKNFLRSDLSYGIVKSLELNAKNADLLGLDEIKIFEIGKVFPKTGEQTSLAIGIKNIKKKQEKEKEKIKKVRDELFAILKADYSILCTVDDSGGIISVNNKAIGITNNIEGILEINLDALIASLPVPNSYDGLGFTRACSIEYKKFSSYPYIVRDIALFVPTEFKMEEVQKEIAIEIKSSADKLLVKGPDLFDEFEKEGKKSLAFRIIFQSFDRTLSDEEVNGYMEKLYKVVKDKGWQVR